MRVADLQRSVDSVSRKRRIRSYHFSVGDTVDGQLGLCARVFERSKAGAVKRLRHSLGERTTAQIRGPHGRPIAFVEVYLNALNINVTHIDEVEDATPSEVELHAPFLR